LVLAPQRHGLKKVDNVLYTHAHLDHIAGFDELRAFCWHRSDKLPLYGNKGCMDEIQRIFSWAFSEKNTYLGYVRPEAAIINDPFQLGDLHLTPIPVIHGSVETSGYKFTSSDGTSVVYISDVKEIPAHSYGLIGQPDYLIIDCLREEIHPSHMCLEEALTAIETVQAKQAYLTHISHEMDCNEVAKNLPKNVAFSYDTQIINF